MTVEPTRYGVFRGDLRVDEEVKVTGVIKGNVTVVRGGELTLEARCSGDLVVEVGGQVYLQGTVDGDAINRGGYLEVNGVVNGALRREGGETIVTSKAIVNEMA
jgi:cytoskeletal protein CcmA (bactofilin family)